MEKNVEQTEEEDQRMKDEKEVMNLIWQGLYHCQDNESIQRGPKYANCFMVWRGGTAYRVSVELDKDFTRMRAELNKAEEE